ncbi:EamA family transporter RarD [Catellatospora citrea]|uniref:Protein RarD n=1 Tax=Catellatospora citrea TaxID=53366 RepID=A0A8J3KPG3_9ACTN|nr:EamA family transporter RarD [Catellatospora citrea]RKE09160.1 chloramphenicol-sensitive protein RarD [Catellatospora citrea]GIF99664.1 protein RarD [Catellatospora citrea]
MSQLRLGYLYGFGAYALWGFFPAYFKLLKPAGPVEVLAHRIAWSALFMVLVLTAVRRWRQIAALLRKPATVGGIALAAVFIGVNWGTYIYGVNVDRVVETSLGYFINPLVVIVLGVLVLGERLRPAQWAAVGVGTFAVLVLAVDYGHPPWIALILAISFALYGLTKKRLALPPADGLFVESAVLTLPALAVLGWLAFSGDLTFGHVSTGHTLLLAAAGVITAIPLLMFAGAANRIPLTGLGMLQYVAPTLQLALGVFAFHEPMPPARLFGFGLVWLALAVFTWDGLRNARRNRLALATGDATPLAATTRA